MHDGPHPHHSPAYTTHLQSQTALNRRRRNSLRPFGPGTCAKGVNETLSGDFFMLMKPKFLGLRTYVPFRDGVIVEDVHEWVREEKRKA